MSDWQPIETAPKDGTWLWVLVNGERHIARWFKKTGLWMDISGYFLAVDPTRWMPYPDPPETTP